MGILHDQALRTALPHAQQFGMLDVFVFDGARIHGSGIRNESRNTIAGAARSMMTIAGTCPHCYAIIEASRWDAHAATHRPDRTIREWTEHGTYDATTNSDHAPIELGPA